MADLLTPANVMFAINSIAILFGIFLYFKNPQVRSEKLDALLAQKVQWTTEGVDRRFKEVQESFNALLLQSNNQIHTVDTKVDHMGKELSSINVSIATLATIINERIPKK